jgi:hypothetical protein
MFRLLRYAAAAERDLHRSAADVDHQQAPGRPAVPAVCGEVGQTCLVLPGQELWPHPAFGLQPVQDQFSIRGVPHGGRHEGVQLVDAELACRAQGTVDGPDDSVHAGRRDRAEGVELLTEECGRLQGVGRQWWRATAGVDHLKLSRTGADVQHAQSHGHDVPNRRPFMRRRAGITGCRSTRRLRVGRGYPNPPHGRFRHPVRWLPTEVA